MIQNLLKEDLTDYIKRNQLIENVELISGNLGIASGEDQDVYDLVHLFLAEERFQLRQIRIGSVM